MTATDNYLRRMFEDHTGAIARTIPGYGSRPGQMKLAEAIDDTIVRGGVLLGEAPTGSGKSLAYLVPAIHRAITKNRSVLVVTANKGLQEQLIEKDLPALSKAFESEGHMFSFQLVKGRANYLCQRELSLYENGAPIPNLNLEDITQLEALAMWGSAHLTGDQSDAPAVSQKVWSALSVSGERCAKRQCPFFETCFAEKPLRSAETATVVVANYDLFFSKIVHGNDSFWSRFHTVIFDECHELANIARKCFGSELGVGNFNQLANDISQYMNNRELARVLRANVNPFFDGIVRYAVESENPRITEKSFINVDDLTGVLREIATAADGKCGACSNVGLCGTCAMRMKIRDRAETFAVFLEEFVDQSGDTTAYWIDKPNDFSRIAAVNVFLCAQPYRVGARLSRTVFARYPAVICVSATMTSGGHFNFIRDEFGLNTTPPKPKAAPDPDSISLEDDDEDREPIWRFGMYDAKDRTHNVRALRVPSPFNYAKQAKFVVPLGIPWPEMGELFDNAAADAIQKLIEQCKGRTLVLFTSWRRLKLVAEHLEGKINYPLLVQGTAPNKVLTQMFRDETDSVLLATKSFWMGLDVQGEALSCLVIDKLPLESLSDPLIDMMREKHPDSFWNEFYFPRAAIELAQGAGRLIRSVDDRGVFVLLDSRILGKSYGGLMIRSLPFAGFSKNLADAGKFLTAGAK
jgi:ATP-dependent DNA helicase DinG